MKSILIAALICSFPSSISTEVLPKPKKVSFDPQISCLAQNIYHEARGSTKLDQVAVGWGTMNRSKSGIYPSTICEVVFQKYQFSWTMNKKTITDRQAFIKSFELASEIYYNQIKDPTNNATHFHTSQINPAWAKVGIGRKKIGAHIYMRLS